MTAGCGDVFYAVPQKAKTKIRASVIRCQIVTNVREELKLKKTKILKIHNFIILNRNEMIFLKLYRISRKTKQDLYC